MGASPLRRARLPLIVATQVLLSLAYALTLPAFEGPDEQNHCSYAAFLAQTSRLPVMPGFGLSSGGTFADEMFGAHHPPLYHALLAAGLRLAGVRDLVVGPLPNRAIAPPAAGLSDTPRVPADPLARFAWLHGHDELAPVSPEIRLLHGMRLLNVLLGAALVLAVHRLARRVFVGAPGLADGAAAAAAWLPIVAMQCGVLGNDLLVALLGTWALVLLVDLAEGRCGGWLAGLRFGLVTGAALLSKLSALSLGPIAALVLGVLFVRRRAQRGRLLAWAVAALGVVLLMTVGVFVRNQLLYGSPLAHDVQALSYPGTVVPAERAWEWVLTRLPRALFRSLMGTAGWGTVPPPAWVLAAGAFMGGVALLGWASALLGRSRSADADSRAAPRFSMPALLVCATAGVTIALATWRYNFDYIQPQARIVFTALGPLAIGVAGGWALLTRGLPPRVARVLGTLVAVAWLAIDVWLWAGHVRPALDPAQALSADPVQASLSWGATREPLREGIALLQPPDGAALVESPAFAWRLDDVAGARLDGRSPRFTLDVFADDGQVLLALDEQHPVELTAEQLTLPVMVWEALPTEQPISWRVRVMPDRQRGQLTDDMPASAARRLTRRAVP